MDLNTVTSLARPRMRAELPAPRRGDAFLAGGTWLMSEPQPHLRRLIDLQSFDWPPIAVRPDGIEIAATCTLAKLEQSPLVTPHQAGHLFAQACRTLWGSFKIREAATIGGNLCLALPASPIAPLATALDAVFELWLPDGTETTVPAVGFITGAGTTRLEPGAILRSLFIPAHALSRRAHLRQASLTTHGRSAALLIGTTDPRSGAFALTIAAATIRPLHLEFRATPTAAELDSTILAALTPALLHDDVHGDPAWRLHMARRLAATILETLA